MKELDSGYSAEVDQIARDAWHLRVQDFADASFYQTWSFGAVHSGPRNLHHAVLRHDGRVVALAQVRLYLVPPIARGMAYVTWGPLWRLKNEPWCRAHLKNILRALVNEFVVRRKLYLRIAPKVVLRQDTEPFRDIYAGEGFKRREDPQETVVLDLSSGLEQIRQNLEVSRNWRNAFKKATRSDVEFVEGRDAAIIAEVLQIADEMKDRKNFYGQDQRELFRASEDLPPEMKLHMVVCRHEGAPVAALGWPVQGTTGIPLVGGTGNKGVKINSSYLLWWKMIEFYQTHGFHWLDAGGVNARRNPGGYYFKTHLLGRSFVRPDRYLGVFDASTSPLSSLLFKVLVSGREFVAALGRRAAGLKRLRSKGPPRDEGHGERS